MKSNSLETLLIKLFEDFPEWDAHKLGLINDDGKVIKEPCEVNEGEMLLPSEKLAQEIALSDTVKLMIKVKKYIGEANLAKLELYIQTLKEKENNRIRKQDVLVEKVNKKHKIKEVAFNVERLLTKEGISREEYLNYLLEK
jgi:hypothetical protein